LLTRLVPDQVHLRAGLEGQGLDVLQWPGISLEPVMIRGGEKALGDALCQADAVVFPSPGAVRCAWLQWPQLGELLIALAPRIYAQGFGTRTALQARGIEQILTPLRTDASGLAARILDTEKSGARVVLMRGTLAGALLPQLLTDGGLVVDSLVVYANRRPEGLARSPRPLDCAVYASPSAAHNHLAENPWLQAVPGVAYGPTTARWLLERGQLAQVEMAREPSWHAVLEAIQRVLKGSGS
jgi:uroporphyrinogen-III synthase